MTGRKLTAAWFRHHLAYSWWKYVLLTVLCWVGVDVLFAMTAYRPPQHRKLELYVLNGFAATEPLHDALWPRVQARCEDQEELTVLNINLTSGDTYAYMQFSTYVAAQQGDVCLMPRSELLKLVNNGVEYALAELTPYVESGVIDPRGIDLSSGRFRAEDGTEGLYAIAADSLYGLLEYGIDPADSYLVMLDYNGNDDNAAALMDLMIEHYRQEKPEGYDALHESLQNGEIIF